MAARSPRILLEASLRSVPVKLQIAKANGARQTAAFPTLRQLAQLNRHTLQTSLRASSQSTPCSNTALNHARAFTTSSEKKAKNRIYTSVRRPDELETYILSSTSSRIPLVTFWTASYCSTCKTVAPMLERLIASGAGETPEGNSVSYCEVEFDSPDMMGSDLGMRYMITGLPTLVSFDRGEVMNETRCVDATKLRDEKWLREWIEREAKRKGDGSGGPGGGIFGGLFGYRK